MINKNELLFAVDENDQPIKPVERFRAHNEGVWHRAAHVWVLNSRKEILCQKRSMLKDHNPGKWEAFFGGHVLAGMSPVQGAVQELQEELGLSAAESDLKLYKVIKHYFEEKNKEFIYVYLFFWNGSVDQLRFEKEEMDEVKWAAFDEILESHAKQDPTWTWNSYTDIPDLLNYLKNNA